MYVKKPIMDTPGLINIRRNRYTYWYLISCIPCHGYSVLTMLDCQVHSMGEYLDARYTLCRKDTQRLIKWVYIHVIKMTKVTLRINLNPLPCGIYFSLTAVGPIRQIKRTTLTKKKRFGWRQCSSIWPPSEYTSTSFLPPSCRGQCVQSHVMTSVQADWAAAVKRWRYLRPTRSDTAATNSVIGTTKPCFYRHPTHPDQRSLRPSH